ncbi:hypothetical protein Taro_004057 [Colocasia esculenta]|uniref:RRM domain-containing protein n=1 Tax=Colocasia esculenta TaxID=4460 RepID=A0A843TLD7_COLES|nr:hypothetical protein [Colocasia esculenta]
MAKKRKLAVVSEPQAQQEQEPELLDGPSQQDAPEAAVVDEILPDAEEKPQIPESVEPVPASDPAAAVDGQGDAVTADAAAAGDAVTADAAAAGDGVGSAVPEAVAAPASISDGGVASEAAAATDAEAGADGVPETSASDVANGDGGAVTEALAAPDAEEDEEPESIQKLLEPLSKEQLIDLLCETAEKHADVVERVQRMADEDPVHRKIFVHGLGWDTTAETLGSFFRQYGAIEDLNVVCDKITGKSKGYGFILFKHRAGVRRALKEPQKKIGNRMTACQMASAGPVPPPAPPLSEYTQRKIYVSNVSADLDARKLLQFFSKFGEIEEGPLGLDKQTGKPKGFALFVYKSADSARKALEEPHKNFEGHILHCQKAIDGPKPNKPGFHPHQSSTALYHGVHQAPVAVSGSQRPQYTRSEMGNFGHLMAPTGPPGGSVAGFNPAIGQALASLLTTPGAGLGLTNLLGPLSSQGASASVVNSGAHGMQSAYGNQPVGAAGSVNPSLLGAYGGQTSLQGGYGNASMGQGTVRGQKAAGHKGGVVPYAGH